MEQAKNNSLRGTITQITEQLIAELQGENLTPSEKISFLKTLLPYSVGRLPNAAVNYQIRSGQPTSGRVIELSEDGGRKDEGGFFSSLSM